MLPLKGVQATASHEREPHIGQTGRGARTVIPYLHPAQRYCPTPGLPVANRGADSPPSRSGSPSYITLLTPVPRSSNASVLRALPESTPPIDC
jgi:hypothetical protein